MKIAAAMAKRYNVDSPVSRSSLERLVRSLQAARQRALYWSGNPHFTAKRFKPGARRGLGGPDEQYELALNDIENLSMSIEAITGAEMKRYDPKAAFALKFIMAMGKRSNSAICGAQKGNN